ncbi:MAG: DsbE family thiol:disulfide interchange protein [Proteobacteria bacterium]|jgi:cytochrome c biogenesis protein CcmG, thiol:disulfide interchange protein DsbE|nr:DsbE family thiol:disulfide interchange protein [Pseudomonadota bacterium]MCG6936226.1 DsbE family thiol:disulfide interchange protein [Pseudomonadota bacterium]
MWRYLIPLGLFIVLVVFLSIGLKLDPRDVPSPLIDKPAPAFSLPELDKPQQHVSPANMKGKVWLLNVWASWCVSCRAEHPVLNALAQTGEVTLIGLNYKDTLTDAKQWLQQRGNPYSVIAFDQDGRVGIDWGVYGVPETFVIDKQGMIRYKHTGPVTRQALKDIILPLVRELKKEPA